MKINELNSGQGSVEVEGTIKEVGEVRTFNKFGKELSVANAILEDDSGNVKLSLWNDDATRFKAGDKVKIVNGYVNEFQGEAQLTSGKFGSMEKIDESSEGASAPTEETTSQEETPTEPPAEMPEEPEDQPIEEDVI